MWLYVLFIGKRNIEELPVKCTNSEKGCEWEGTIEGLDKHLVKNKCEKKKPAHCYLFVHDSNLWIEGKKAEGKKLVDASIDSRYRVDLGKFLRLVTKRRPISKAFLYGSTPPPRDSLWKAAERNKFEVHTFKRSGNGREKELHGAMSRDMMKYLYEGKQKAVFIVATGDRNFKPLIEVTLEKNIPLELWFWKDGIAQDFYKMAKENKLFTVNHLDTLTKQFSFTSYMSATTKKRVDPNHALVYKEFPEDEMDPLANHLSELSRIFFISQVDCKVKGKKDLIVEFPNTSIEDIFHELAKLKPFEYHPISYVEYHSKLTQTLKFELLLTNRFQPLEEESISDEEEAPVMQDTPGSVKLQKHVTPWPVQTATTAELLEVQGQASSNTVFSQKTYCPDKDHCKKALSCPLPHTPAETKLFDKFPTIQFQFYKAKECNRKSEHTTAQKRENCSFAHTEKDSWCLKCKTYGHLTTKCKNKT